MLNSVDIRINLWVNILIGLIHIFMDQRSRILALKVDFIALDLYLMLSLHILLLILIHIHVPRAKLIHL